MVMRLRSQARMEVEVPGVAMQMRNRMLMDLGRGNDEHRIGDPLDAEIEEGWAAVAELR